MFILLFLLNCFALSNESLQCLNKDKSNVDWYSIIIYKKKYEAENQLFYNCESKLRIISSCLL